VTRGLGVEGGNCAHETGTAKSLCAGEAVRAAEPTTRAVLTAQCDAVCEWNHPMSACVCYVWLGHVKVSFACVVLSAMLAWTPKGLRPEPFVRCVWQDMGSAVVTVHAHDHHLFAFVS
jgi:hypothetical protein